MDQVATREEGECCNVGAACRTYQDLQFSDADESLPVLGLVHERIVKRKHARYFQHCLLLTNMKIWWMCFYVF